VLVRRPLCRSHYPRVSREVEIVRSREHQTLAPADRHARGLPAGYAPHAPVERALAPRLELRRERVVELCTFGNWLK
jgi:hypothetical protein